METQKSKTLSLRTKIFLVLDIIGAVNIISMNFVKDVFRRIHESLVGSDVPLITEIIMKHSLILSLVIVIAGIVLLIQRSKLSQMSIFVFILFVIWMLVFVIGLFAPILTLNTNI